MTCEYENAPEQANVDAGLCIETVARWYHSGCLCAMVRAVECAAAKYDHTFACSAKYLQASSAFALLSSGIRVQESKQRAESKSM